MDLTLIKENIKKAKHLVFLGGAGVSTASGILDFRSPEGLYNLQSEFGVSYEEMLSRSYFLSHPREFYRFYYEFMVHEEAKPNKAHRLLSKYEESGHEIWIITQNIDNLHKEAGSKHVLELHGNLKDLYCERCGSLYDLKDVKGQEIPRCKCGAILHPNIVLYEENLPFDVLKKAIEVLKEADFLLVAGTSLKVEPAASLIYYASSTFKLLINYEATPYDDFFDYIVHDDISLTLEKIL